MKAIGLDIGVSGIKIAVLEGSARRPRLVRLIDHRLDGQKTTRAMSPEALGALVSGLFAKHKLPLEQVVSGAPLAQCMVRDVQVPFTRADQIQKTIKFQAESAFHSVAIDDMVVDHYKVGENGPRSRVIVIGLKKDALEAHLDTLAAADIDPVSVDLDVAALFNAYARLRHAGGDKPSLLVDLGAGALKVCLVVGGRIAAVRSLRANAADVKVEEQGGAGGGGKRPSSLEDLRRGLLEEERQDTFFADDEGRLPVVILDEEQSQLFDFDLEETRQSVLDKVFFEIDRTLARTVLTEPIDRIVLTGGGASSKGIVEAFAEHFQCKAERLDLSSLGAGKLATAEREALNRVGATAVGLALKGMGVDAGGFDLRTEEFEYAGTFERLKSGLACTLVLCFVLFFLVAYRFQVVETDRFLLKQQRIRFYQRAVFSTTFGEDPRAGSVLANVRQRERQIRQRLGQSTPDVISALDVLRDFARATKEAGKTCELKTANIRQKQQIIQLVVKERTDVYDIKQKLEDGDYMVTIAQEKIDADPRTQALTATLTLKLKADDKKPVPGGGPPPPRG